MSGGYGAHIGQTRVHSFILDSNPDQAMNVLTPELAVATTHRVGDDAPVSGTFTRVGRAVARTKNPQADYGGSDAAVCDAMLAEYEAATGTVHPLDTLGMRNPRTEPWVVGKDIQLLADPNEDSKGHVVRGSLMGDAGFDAHVYIAAAFDPSRPRSKAQPIILHHREKGPPKNSTLAYDPDTKGKVARLSDALRIAIVSPPSEWCTKPSQTVVGNQKGKSDYWVCINGTKHGGYQSGWAAVAFANNVGLFSHEIVGGPWIPATKKHLLGNPPLEGPSFTQVSTVTGANNCDGLWTRGDPNFDAPIWIEDVEEPNVAESKGHPVRVHLQHDKDGAADGSPFTHSHLCGKKIGMRKLWVNQLLEETPPCKTTKPPGPVTGPAMAVLPQAYYVGTHLAGGFQLGSHPGA